MANGGARGTLVAVLHHVKCLAYDPCGRGIKYDVMAIRQICQGPALTFHQL